MSITKQSTAGMAREEWLQSRCGSIGGSDAAPIIGLSKYGSPYSVWADKTGRLPEKEETEAIRLGNDLEDYVARRWAEATGKKIKRYPYIIRNSDYPFAHANIDRAVIGEKAGLECKTTSTLDIRQFNGVEFPEKYYAQCVHYLAVTGWDRWYLAVLVFGRGFFTYVLERDEDEIAALMQAEGSFWPYVAEDFPPMADGSDATTEAISTIWRDSDGGTMALIGRDPLLEEYFSLREQKKAVEERISAIENIIKEDMEETERAESGNYTVSWKSQTRTQFDLKKYQKDNPNANLDLYFKTVKSRPFRVSIKE